MTLATNPWPVGVIPVGMANAGALLWRFQGRLRVAVFAKATFALVPGGVMTPTTPQTGGCASRT